MDKNNRQVVEGSICVAVMQTMRNRAIELNAEIDTLNSFWDVKKIQESRIRINEIRKCIDIIHDEVYKKL